MSRRKRKARHCAVGLPAGHPLIATLTAPVGFGSRPDTIATPAGVFRVTAIDTTRGNGVVVVWLRGGDRRELAKYLGCRRVAVRRDMSNMSPCVIWRGKNMSRRRAARRLMAWQSDNRPLPTPPGMLVSP